MMVKLGPDHPETLKTQTKLAQFYLQARKYAEAEAIARPAREPWRKRIQSMSNLGHIEREQQDLADLEGVLGECLLRQDKFVDAETALRASLAVRGKKADGLWSTFNTQSMLGGALLGQKKYAEAEPLLKASYEGMKAREKMIRPQRNVGLMEPAERLVQLYEATGNAAEAQR